MSQEVNPQNDREILIILSQDVKRLSESINRFSEKIDNFEEKRLADIDERLDSIEKWQSQWSGAWKLITIGLTLLTIAGLIIKLK